MNPVGAGRHPGIATHQHEGGFPHLINHLQPSDGQDALHWCYYTQLSLRPFFDMSAASPPSLRALKARCQLTHIYRDIIRRRSIVLPQDGCDKKPGSLCPLLEKPGEQLWELRGPYLPCSYSLMSYSCFTCRIPSQSHTQKSLSAHSQKVYRNTDRAAEEWGGKTSSQVMGYSVRHTFGSRDVTVSFALHGHQESTDCVQICAHHNNFLKTQNVTCG